MKYKIFSIALSLFLFTIGANAADKIHASALEEFSTVSPKSSIDVSVLESGTLGTHSLSSGDILHCNIKKVINPKRGKRSASFTVVPVYYESNNEKVNITESLSGKYSAKILSKEELRNIDAKKAGTKAVLTVGNHFVKGVAPVASLATGMVKNEEGKRLRSGVKQVYKDSFLSYAEKGQHLDIKPGEQFYLIFKPADSQVSDDIDDEAEYENE